jgi:hypothetical protein
VESPIFLQASSLITYGMLELVFTSVAVSDYFKTIFTLTS